MRTELRINRVDYRVKTGEGVNTWGNGARKKFYRGCSSSRPLNGGLVATCGTSSSPYRSRFILASLAWFDDRQNCNQDDRVATRVENAFNAILHILLFLPTSRGPRKRGPSVYVFMMTVTWFADTWTTPIPLGTRPRTNINCQSPVTNELWCVRHHRVSFHFSHEFFPSLLSTWCTV